MMVEHHTKYKEIHGVDETIWISKSEHSKLNHRELFPEVTKEELMKIQHNAHCRTEKGKKYSKEYRKLRQDYEKNIQHLYFEETMMPYVKHREHLTYNKKLDTVQINCGFFGNNKKNIICGY